jgi:hypothetical protein
MTYLFILLSLLGCVVLGWYSIRKKSPLVPLEAPPAATETPRVLRRVLDIPGTQKMTSGYEPLRAWGVPLSEIQDVSCVLGPCLEKDLPYGAKACLALCFKQGHVRGIEASRVVAGAPLRAGQGLYFVLSESSTGVPRLTALVG